MNKPDLPNSFRQGPDARGHFGNYGGRFVAETLMPLILELEVAPSNRVSRSADKEVEPIRVEHAALGQGGEDAWLATGEKKEEDEEEGAAEARSIKVWRWDAQLKT